MNTPSQEFCNGDERQDVDVEKNIFFAGFLVIVSSFFFTAVALCVKKTNPQLSRAWILIFRGLIGAFLSLILLFSENNQFFSFTIMHNPLLLMRSFLVIIQVWSSYGCYEYLPVTASVSLLLLGPLWILFFELFHQKSAKQNLKKKSLFWIFFGYGVILWLYPPTGPSDQGSNFLLGWLCALLSTATGAASDLFGKYLVQTKYNAGSVLFLSYFVPGLFGFFWHLLNLSTLEHTVMPSSIDFFWLSALGLFSFAGHTLLMKGLMYGNTTLVSAFSYTRIFFAVLLSYLFYRIYPSSEEIIGIFFIFLMSWNLISDY